MKKRGTWRRAGTAAHSIWLQKFSATTYLPDVKDASMPDDMRRRLHAENVSTVWRARVGRATRWYYGWSADEALALALDDAGVV